LLHTTIKYSVPAQAVSYSRGMAITNGERTYHTINEALINMLKAGTRYGGYTSSTVTILGRRRCNHLVDYPKPRGVLWERICDLGMEKR